MPSYWELMMLVAPVFALIAVGVGIHRRTWIGPEAETGLIKIVVNICFPCLIFDSVSSSAAVREPGNLLLPPLVAFSVMCIGLRLGLWLGRALGLHIGTGLRTFALTSGVQNYSYLPLPIMAGIWGQESTGVLLVHTVGAEAAVWTVGLLVVSGMSLREGWRRLFSPILISLVLAVIANVTGLAPLIPSVLMAVVRGLAACAIPLGLVMTGINLANYLHTPRELFDAKTSIAANVLRLGLMPLIILAIARFLPCSLELKRVLIVQAAMPSAVIPIIISRLYGGHPRTAVQIVLSTTALGLFVIPLWLKVGLAWVEGR